MTMPEPASPKRPATTTFKKVAHLLSYLRWIIVALLIAHIYVAWRLLPVMPTKTFAIVFIVAMFLPYLMIIAGFVTRLATNLTDVNAVSRVGFLLLGFFSWMFVLTVIRDVALLALWGVSLGMDADSLVWRDDFRTWSVAAIFLISLSATLIGLYNVRRLPSVVKVDIHIPKLPDALKGFTLAQISDLHIDKTSSQDAVSQVVNLTNSLNADAVVLTGDLVDGTVPTLREQTSELSRLKGNHGVFAITGNHEYYSGAEHWIAEYERLGLNVLLNTHVTIEIKGEKLILAGVTDYVAQRFDPDQASDPVKALANSPHDAGAKILLAHQPRSMYDAQAAGFDLQLSGHTHGGQFWPWMYFVAIEQPIVAGLHRHKSLQVYVSRGTGFWGPPMRIGARAEITLLTLR